MLAILCLLGWLFMSRNFTLGLALGGLISIINFHWLYRDLKKIFQKLTDRPKGPIMIRYYIRFIITGIVLFFIIAKTEASVIGLLVGLSLVVVNMLLNVLINALTLKKTNPLEEDREQ